MYDVMVGITWIALTCICIGESIYNIYQCFKLWLDDKPITKYVVKYDPFLKSDRYRCGSDLVMAALVRIALGVFFVPVVALAWPVALLIVALIVIARHMKHVHKLKKGVDNT